MSAITRLQLQIDAKTINAGAVDALQKALDRLLAMNEKAASVPVRDVPVPPEVPVTRPKETAVTKPFEKFSKDVGDFIRDPLNAAGNAAESFLGKLGPVGTGVVALGAAAVIGGKQLLGMAEALGDAAEAQTNFSIRTGISVESVEAFVTAASLAGVESGAFAAASIHLSDAIEGTSAASIKQRAAIEALIGPLRQTNGQVRAAEDIWVSLADAIGSVEDPIKKIALASDIFGAKSAKQLLPLLGELKSSARELKASGLGLDAKTAAELDSVADSAKKIQAVLGAIARQSKIDIVLAIKPVVDQVDRFVSNLGAVSSGSAGAGLDPLSRLAVTAGVAAGATFRGEQLAKDDLGGFRYGASELRRERPGSVAARAALAGAASGLFPSSDRLDSMRANLTDLREKLATVRAEAETLAKVRNVEPAAAEDAVARLKKLTGEYAALEQNIKAAEKAERDLQAQQALIEQLGIFRTSEERLIPGFRAPNAPSLRSRRDVLSGQVQTLQELGLVLSGGPALLISSDPAADAKAEDQERERLRAFGAGLIELSKIRDETAARAKSNARELAQLEADAAARRIDMLTGPNGEAAAALRVRDIRLASLEEQLRLGADAHQVELERRRVLLEAEERLRAVELRRLEDRKRFGADLFSAAVGGGLGGVQQFVSGVGFNAARTIAGNAFGEFTRSISGRFTLPGQVDASGNLTPLGRILKDSPFAVDPLRLAMDANTVATRENTAAQLGRATAGASGGGVAGAVGSIGGLLPGNLGGVVTGAAGIGSSLLSLKSARLPSLLPESKAGGVTALATLEMPDGSRQVLAVPAEIKSLADASGGRGSSRAAGLIGKGAALAAGTIGVIGGIQQGGAAGTLNAIAAGAGTVAALSPEPFSKAAAMVVALTASLVGSLLPDPRKRRRAQMESILKGAVFNGPDSIDSESLLGGAGSIGADEFGGPVIVVNTIDAKSFIDRAPDVVAAWSRGVRQSRESFDQIAGSADAVA